MRRTHCCSASRSGNSEAQCAYQRASRSHNDEGERKIRFILNCLHLAR